MKRQFREAMQNLCNQIHSPGRRSSPEDQTESDPDTGTAEDRGKHRIHRRSRNIEPFVDEDDDR